MFEHDLEPYSLHLPFRLEGVRVVGWLDSKHAYPAGRVPDGLVATLETIVLTRTATFDAHVNVVRGIHPCNLCGQEVELRSGGRSHPLGMSEIWLPDTSGWLAAPQLVLHHIRDHGYAPPAAFVQAVRAWTPRTAFLGQAVYDRLVSERTAMES